MSQPTDATPDPLEPPPPPAPEDTDDSAPEPPPADPDHVPYAEEYVVPDPHSQSDLSRLVPDEPTPLPPLPPPA